MHSGKATDFCNEQLNKNVKCGKEYFTLNVSNIVLVIFKSFITFCWGKKGDKKNSHIKSQQQYFGKKIAIRLFSQIVQPYSTAPLSPQDQSLQRYSALTAEDNHLDHGYFVPVGFVA